MLHLWFFRERFVRSYGVIKVD